MILIVDSGSTKADWCVVKDRESYQMIKSLGVNALLMSVEDMCELIAREVMPCISSDDLRQISHVYFYGAGCVSDEVKQKVANAIGCLIPTVKVEVETDLLGAARALCGHEPGVACILGTGSNSCYYDGTEIVLNTPPLGYILGDEGGGANLGKLLVGNVLKQQLPDAFCQKFYAEAGLDKLSIIDRVYRQPAPNRFLASLTPFIKANLDCPEIEGMVVSAFRSFFIRNLEPYRRIYPSLSTASFIGSVAHHFRPQLESAARSVAWSIPIILQSPLPTLIAYHTCNYSANQAQQSWMRHI